MEKEMATHSSILAWRVPWTEKPGRLQFTGSQRVGHDWEANMHYGLNFIPPIEFPQKFIYLVILVVLPHLLFVLCVHIFSSK